RGKGIARVEGTGTLGNVPPRRVAIATWSHYNSSEVSASFRSEIAPMKITAVLGCLALLFAPGRSVHAQDRALRLLWPEGAPGAKGAAPDGVKDGRLPIEAGAKLSKVFNDAKLADAPGVVVFPATKANGAAVVVCPGGGYGFLAADHEGEAVANWLN